MPKMNTSKNEEKLLTHIEKLRQQLNKNINFRNNTPQNSPEAYAISLKLDKLIYKYMITHSKAL